MGYQVIIAIFFLLGVHALHAQQTTCQSVSIAEKQAFFKKGPQALIAGIRVIPKFKEGDTKNKRFLGFTIEQILPQSSLFNGPILVGDVIISMNGEPIGRPEHFMKAWDMAKKSNKIDIEIEREGQKLIFSWCIQSQ